MLERRSPREEISRIRSELESIDADVESVVASEEAIENAIYAMGEKASRYLSDISYSLEAGLEGLASAFEWGVAEVVYHLELQRKELKRIVEILEAPLETQAKELRRRAEFAHRNDWIDEALTDFLEAEKRNYADFTIHQSLGNIYLRKNDPTKAQEYYEKAAKYAHPHSSYYTAYALWHLGQARYLRGDMGAAYEATKEATRVQPDLVQAVYDHARYCALLMKEEESMAYLRKAIEIDRNYSLKALTDESFAKIAQALRALLETLRQEAKQRAQKALEDYHECLRLAADIDSDFEWYPAEMYRREPEEEVRRIGALIKKDSYFDLLDAEKLANDTRYTFVEQAARWLKSQIARISEQIKAKESSISEARLTLSQGPKFDGAPSGLATYAVLWLLFGVLLANLLEEINPIVFLAAMFLAPIIPTLFVLLLASARARRRHGSKYRHIIQSNSQRQQTLQSDLFQLNSLYARAKELF